jgi:hypothetical protein
LDRFLRAPADAAARDIATIQRRATELEAPEDRLALTGGIVVFFVRVAPT